ncbi:hypothetical protein THAOC_18205, partial [Thalassiosira oceanica]
EGTTGKRKVQILYLVLKSEKIFFVLKVQILYLFSVNSSARARGWHTLSNL